MATNPPTDSDSEEDTLRRSRALLDELQAKMRRLVDDFASGTINRTQFHSLYDRYQRQISKILQLTSDPADRSAMIAGDDETTFNIKKRLTARVLGVSIYSNQSGLPIDTLGEFEVDPALLIPMLSSYRDATREIFKAGMRSTAMENNQWLSFVPGNYSTLIALFSVEPSTVQLATVERMHHDFEDANKAAFEKGNVDPATLAYPFLTFVREAHSKFSETGTHRSLRPADKNQPD